MSREHECVCFFFPEVELKGDHKRSGRNLNPEVERAQDDESPAGGASCEEETAVRPGAPTQNKAVIDCSSARLCCGRDGTRERRRGRAASGPARQEEEEEEEVKQSAKPAGKQTVEEKKSHHFLKSKLCLCCPHFQIFLFLIL